MGKYTALQERIFSIFGDIAWITENIPTFPSDVIPTNVGDEHVRVSIIPSSVGINSLSTAGICIIDIFTAFGNGPARANVIADTLDRYLQYVTAGSTPALTVQFGMSTLVPKGKDKDNPSLARSQYTIPFNLYGVQ